MEWSKLLSDYYEDGAVVAVGEEGEVLFLRSIAWSSKKDLAGLVPSWQIERFGLKNIGRRVTKLVEHELWTVVDGGWQITNYEKIQAEITSMEKRRKADRARKQARRSAGKSADLSADLSADNPHAPSRLSPVVGNTEVERRETRDETSALGLLPSQDQRDLTREGPIGLAQ
jgi:hypothetical protein